MNLDLDLSVVRRFFSGLLTELRQKRLWPVALLLLVAIAAVPVLLSKSASPAPQPQAQVPVAPPPPGGSIPALNVQTTQPHSHLKGSGHDPFSTGASAATAGSASSATTVASAVSTAFSQAASSLTGGTSTNTATGSGGSSTATSGGSSSGTSSGTAPSSTPPSITGNAKPKPAPSGLKPTQAYDVALAITNSKGGIDTIDPLKRDSVIPSEQQPLLIELGVARGGNRVFFAVEPGAIPTGPGVCTPGPIDCEVLSLGQDQTEKLSTQQGAIGASQVALFAITSISATDYQSKGAADKARRAVSSAGQALLRQSKFPTLPLFQFEPSVGSVVDLRNLKVGG
jgi:hypothetical protein